MANEALPKTPLPVHFGLFSVREDTSSKAREHCYVWFSQGMISVIHSFLPEFDCLISGTISGAASPAWI